MVRGLNSKYFAEEYAYLDSVITAIEERIPVLLSRLGGSTADLLKSRQEMWDEGRHLILTFDDAVELSGLNEAVDRDSKIYIDSKQEYENLLLLHRSAYFGRFDFKEDGADEYEKFYIGRVTLMSGNYNCMIYDWRAPISSVYYEYGTGRVSYRGPNETFHGEVNLKRQYRIKDGEIKYMFDTESAVHDELLAKILTENTSASLKIIISSIQREQNDAIRNNYCKYLLIYGLAGSGKTSVGLHRMAYILYRYKETIRPDNILILSSNNIFKTYISNILPELGENNVYVSVFKDIYKKYLPDGYKTESYYEQMDAMRNNEARSAEIGLKYSAEFFSFMLRYFQTFSYSFEDVKHGDDIIVAKEFFYSNVEESFNVTISKALTLIEDRSKYYFRQNMKEIKQRIEKEHEDIMFDSELNNLFWKYVQDFINSNEAKIAAGNHIDEIAMYKDILRRYVDETGIGKGVYMSTCTRLDAGVLTHEDIMIVLCISQIIGKVPPETKILHVLIDEAQDCNILQLWFLKNLYPKSFFTILGDINQNITSEAGINDYGLFDSVFGKELKSVHLYKSYRSSGPINALVFRLLGLDQGNNGSEYYDREGDKPLYIHSDDIDTDVYKIITDKAHETHTVGVLMPDIREAERLFNALHNKTDVQLLTDPGKKLEGRVVIMPLILAKGLEFDTAVAINLMAEGKNAKKCRNTAYLAGSRALHSLYYVNQFPLPELYRDCEELLRFY